MSDNFIVESVEVKRVGDWLYDLLPPTELEKILKDKHMVISSSSNVILNIKITLFELESLRDYGHLPESRNCFELKRKGV